MNKTHAKVHEKRQEEKTKCSKILPNNKIITACQIELRVQEMTMNEKLTMIGLKIPHYKMPDISYKVADFVFKGGTKDYIVIN